MRLTMKERIEGLQRLYPLMSPANARFMYAKPADLRRLGTTIVLWSVLWSDDGRVSMHQTKFEKGRPMSVPEWAGWLQVNAPHVLRSSVLASINRSFGSTWNIDRVFGWHFTGATKLGRAKP